MLWLRQALPDTALQAGGCKENEQSVRKGQPIFGLAGKQVSHGEMLAGDHSEPLVPNLENGHLLPKSSHQQS